METVDKYFEVSETAIKDHSMLGAHGRKLCTNLDVYWMTQTCDADENETRKCIAYICMYVYMHYYYYTVVDAVNVISMYVYMYACMHACIHIYNKK